MVRPRQWPILVYHNSNARFFLYAKRLNTLKHHCRWLRSKWGKEGGGGCFFICKSVPACTRLHKAVPSCAWLYPAARGCTSLYPPVLGCTQAVLELVHSSRPALYLAVPQPSGRCGPGLGVGQPYVVVWQHCQEMWARVAVHAPFKLGHAP